MDAEQPAPRLDRDKIQPEEDALDLRFLAQALWRGSWIIGLLMIVGLALGLRAMYGFQPSYSASMIVAPLKGSGAGGGQAGGISSIARSVGLSIDTSSAGPTMLDRLQRVAASVKFAEHMQEKYGLLQKVYSGAWDESSESWTRPTGSRFEYEQRIRTFFHLATWRAPSVETLANYISGSVRFDRMKDGFFQVSVSNQDGQKALELLTRVYSEADNILRNKDKQYTAERKAYLEQQMLSARIAESRVMLANLLSSEEQRSMLLDSHLPYAARIVEPPHLFGRPSTASVRDELAVRLIFSFALGIGLSLILAAFRRARQVR